MKAHIITIGDEILCGETLNSNAAFIGEELTANGIDVVRTSVIADKNETIISEFKDSLEKYDVVISTGGLGPTHDDKTLNCIVEMFETKLVMNDEVLTDIKERFNRRGIPLTKVNEDQALVPEISEVIRNSKGTAPGVWIQKENKIFCAMPGVPYEMKEMVRSFVIPKLQQETSQFSKNFSINLLTTGIAESILFERLGNLKELLGDVKLAFLPSQYGVRMKLTTSGVDDEIVQNKLLEIEQQIRSKVGRYIYSKSNEKLEEVVGRLLKDRNLTLSVAESCTGGLISSRITNIAGSSEYFERGFTTYSNGAKVEHLRVNEDIIQERGSVSIDIARQMADGVRAVSGTDIGLAVTGIMGPTGGTSEKPVGLVYIGLCDEKICTAKEFRFGKERILNKQRSSQAALEMLRRNILGIPYDE